MTGWNFDLTAIPRFRTETHKRLVKGELHEYQVEVPIRLLLAHPRDGKVYATTWVEPSKFTKGRWSGWTEGTEPVAWQHYPEHPQAGKG